MRRIAVFSLLCTIASAAYAQPALRIAYYSGGQASLYWTSVPGAASYAVERTTAYPAWTMQATGSSGWTQSGLAANTTYIYRIVPRDGSGNPLGAASNPAVVTTHVFANNPLDVNAPMALQHVLDLRTAVASVKAAAGAGSAVWTNTLTMDSLVSDEDIGDVRSNLNAAYNNLGLPLPPYVDPVLSDALIGRVHFQQLRDLARSYPEMVVAGSGSMSEYYFSPNGDSMKDTTTFIANVGFAAGAQRVDFRWRLDIRNQTTTAVVRSVIGSGPAIAYVWDGRNGAGAIQPEAVYGFELIDLDSLPLVIASSSARLDVTAPTATIVTPADAFVVSNIRLAGSGSVTVSGTASDAAAIQQWTLKRTGNAQSTVTLASGTTNLSSGTLTTWQTLPSSGALANGAYTLELTVGDKAGNSAVDTVPVTVGHFTASRSGAQADASAGGSVTYTSVVPYPVHLRIEIRRNGALLRTLVNGPVAAGTRNDVWNLRVGPLAEDLPVPDGPYQYVATVTDGAFSLIWDKSASFPAGPATTQYEYPKCWTGTAWVRCDQTPADLNFDPFGGVPLRIAYCVGGGDPDTGCSGSNPAAVIGKVTIVPETSDLCVNDCFIEGYQAGRQEMLWYGVGTSWWTYLGDLPRLTVIRKFTSIPENMTVVYGTAPVIADVSVAPRMFSPPSAPLPEHGQTFTLNVTSHGSRDVKVTAYFVSMDSGANLRTITTALQAASTPITFTWDGRAGDPQSTLVAPGRYAVTLVVADEIGSETIVRPVVVVRY